MTVTRTMTASLLNEASNHPKVRPYIGGEGPIDLTAFCADPANYALVTEGGGWILSPLLPGVYELHTLFAPEGRGKPYFRAAQEALRYMFTATDCLEILTKCPDDNPGARMAAGLSGFSERFHRADAWAPGVGISYQALTFDMWVLRDKTLQAGGHAFHEALEAAKLAVGSTLPTHPDDAIHDRMVGAAVLMVKAGQTQKAVGLYGRWAVFAGYEPILAISNTVVDIADAIVELRSGEMAVLMVRGAPTE